MGFDKVFTRIRTSQELLLLVGVVNSAAMNFGFHTGLIAGYHHS
jgi:hypothetical protein